MKKFIIFILILLISIPSSGYSGNIIAEKVTTPLIDGVFDVLKSGASAAEGFFGSKPSMAPASPPQTPPATASMPVENVAKSSRTARVSIAKDALTKEKALINGRQYGALAKQAANVAIGGGIAKKGLIAGATLGAGYLVYKLSTKDIAKIEADVETMVEAKVKKEMIEETENVKKRT